MTTEVIVTDKHSTVIVESLRPPQVVVTGIMGPRGPAGTAFMATISDVDVTELTAGSVLVYDVDTQKWKATTALNMQAIECGQF